MADKTGLADEIAVRQQWLLEMWRAQRQENALVAEEVFGLLKSKNRKAIKIIQSEFSHQPGGKVRAALVQELSVEEIFRRLQAFAEEEQAERARRQQAETESLKRRLSGEQTGHGLREGVSIPRRQETVDKDNAVEERHSWKDI